MRFKLSKIVKSCQSVPFLRAELTQSRNIGMTRLCGKLKQLQLHRNIKLQYKSIIEYHSSLDLEAERPAINL